MTIVDGRNNYALYSYDCSFRNGAPIESKMVKVMKFNEQNLLSLKKIVTIDRIKYQ